MNMVFWRKKINQGLEGLVEKEETVKPDDAVKGIDAAGNRKLIVSESYMLSAKPVEAGQSAELLVADKSRVFGKEETVQTRLYEDGKEIASVDGSLLIHEVTHAGEGEHIYHGELISKDGGCLITDDITISFSGRKIDFLPIVDTFLTSTSNAGKATHIVVKGDDIGDDRGIKRIFLYEDGHLFKEVEGSNLSVAPQYETPQTHEYHAEIEDKGGHVVETEKMTVSYSGEAFPPSARWFGANPQRAGRTTRIFVEGRDDSNLDDLKGIESIVLYEDGEKVHEVESEWMIYDVTRDDEGTHQYHALIRNRNGKTAETEPFEVSFLGHDFPPAIKWASARYTDEKGYATILVEGEDKLNVRDDAGIHEIVLYEDGEPIAREQRGTLLMELERDGGTHTYHAQITNNSGYTTRTDPMVVDYQSE